MEKGKSKIEQGQETRKRILEVIIAYIEVHGYPPTVREISEGAGLKSTNTVHSHLLRMFKEGMLETDGVPGAPRAIRVPGYRFVKENNEERNKKL